MTKGAGSSQPGEPYVARFPDSFGNVCIRHITRPDVITRFFDASKKVDLHTQSMQFNLAIEKKWVTTKTGMVVTDAWKMLGVCGQEFKTITEFCDVWYSDILKQAAELEDQDAGKGQVPAVSLTLKPSPSSLSSVTLPERKATEIIPTKHHIQNKKQVKCLWCSRVENTERKTTMKCLGCNSGFCRSAWACWSHLVAIRWVPRKPKRKRGAKKRKICEIIEWNLKDTTRPVPLVAEVPNIGTLVLFWSRG